MENPKHVLLITYYWPPAGGPGVHRWLRFSKYFQENGYQLHVYCPKEAAWPITDQNLLHEVDPGVIVIRNTIFEPHKYLGKKNNPNVGGGLTQSKKSTFFQRFVIWVRGNLFIPDARVYWIKPSYRFLKKYLNDHPEIQTVISTGPPHSLHVIALKLKQKLKLRWLADFRDPWTQIDFYQDLLPGKRADRKQKMLEKTCLTAADEVMTVSMACAEGLEEIGKRKVHVITNGFPFQKRNPNQQLDQQFTISHFGSMPKARNPEVIWKALEKALLSAPEMGQYLRINLYGAVDFSVFESLEQHHLNPYVTHVSMLSHQDSMDFQRKSQVLLLVANNTGNVKGILTGKVFEYLASYRPIIAVGEQDSNLETLMSETNSGVFIDFDAVDQAVKSILDYYQAFRNGTLNVDSHGLENYDSRELVKKLIALL